MAYQDFRDMYYGEAGISAYAAAGNADVLRDRPIRPDGMSFDAFVSSGADRSASRSGFVMEAYTDLP